MKLNHSELKVNHGWGNGYSIKLSKQYACSESDLSLFRRLADLHGLGLAKSELSDSEQLQADAIIKLDSTALFFQEGSSFNLENPDDTREPRLHANPAIIDSLSRLAIDAASVGPSYGMQLHECKVSIRDLRYGGIMHVTMTAGEIGNPETFNQDAVVKFTIKRVLPMLLRWMPDKRLFFD